MIKRGFFSVGRSKRIKIKTNFRPSENHLDYFNRNLGKPL
jgi:hypothetical protein